jgi:hypothetical protein
MDLSTPIKTMFINKTLKPIYKNMRSGNDNFVLDPLSVVVVLAINAFKPIGTKLALYNGCLHLHDSGMLQSAVRTFSGDSKTNIKIINHPLIYACKHFFKSDSKADEDIVYLFKTAKVGLDNLLYTYNDDREIRTCLNTYINIINSVTTMEKINYEMIDMLLKLNVGSADTTSHINIAGNVKNNLIDTLHKTWDVNKISIVINLLKEFENATPYSQNYLFQAIDSFMMCIHEKTREKSQVVFEGRS